MAKLKIGEGIKLEAKFPEVPKMELGKSELMPTNPPSDLKEIQDGLYHLDKVSDRTYQNKKSIEKLQQDLGVLEEKVDNQHDDILELIDAVREVNHEPMDVIKQPEIKSVTIHKDHTKDFEDVYQKLSIDKDELIKRIRNSKTDEINKLKRKLTNLKLICAINSIAGLAALILHLF